MGEEMVWQKTISRGRDRWQARALVAAVGTVLIGNSIHTTVFAYLLRERFPAFVFEAFGISVAFALAAFGLRAATLAGAGCGAMVCLLLTFWTGSLSGSSVRSDLIPLVVLFGLTFVATRIGRQRKIKAGLAESRRGRSAAQVIANLGAAGIASSWMGASLLHWVTRRTSDGYDEMLPLVGTVVLAALAEATADTVSSEIGQAFGGQPVMLTTMRRVAPGTDGAVSVLGTLAGVFAGGVVVCAGRWALRLGMRAAGIALAAGVAGLFFDSLLGATVERRGWMGNDLVNFASTLFATAVAAGLVIVLS